MWSRNAIPREPKHKVHHAHTGNFVLQTFFHVGLQSHYHTESFLIKPFLTAWLCMVCKMVLRDIACMYLYLIATVHCGTTWLNSSVLQSTWLNQFDQVHTAHLQHVPTWKHILYHDSHDEYLVSRRSNAQTSKYSHALVSPIIQHHSTHHTH